VLFENQTSDMIIKKRKSSLPLLAGVCEIIGIGRVTNTWENGNGVYIAVDDYWYGNPGYNTLSIQISTNQPHVSDTQLVFFLLNRQNYTSYGLGDDHGYLHVLRKNRLELCPLLPEGPMFLKDDRSWFCTSDTNLVSFASNLVVAVKTSNTNMLYEVIRDGYRLNPVDSRIHEDSYFAFNSCMYFFPTNYMDQILSDPLLVDDAHYSVRFNIDMITNDWGLLNIHTNSWWW